MNSGTIWAPAKPQMIISGKYAQQQKYWESMLYIDPVFLMNRYRYIRSSSRRLDDYEWHIAWLWEEALKLESVQECRICEEGEPIAFFLVTYEENGRKSLILRSQTCCANRDCRQTVKSRQSNDSDLFPLKFPTFGEPLFRQSRPNKMALKELLAWAFGIKNRARFGAQDLFDVIHAQWQERQAHPVVTNPSQMSLML